MKSQMAYRKRIADQQLLRRLAGAGAVLVEGPKRCGKTTTCEQIARSALYMADPDSLERNLAQAETNIKELLAGDKPRLIDEWQIVPKFWDAVRVHVDHVGGAGHFILTDEEGARTLNSLSALIDTERMKAASFKMVLTAVGEYAYRRPEDGGMRMSHRVPDAMIRTNNLIHLRLHRAPEGGPPAECGSSRALNGSTAIRRSPPP